jgi:hypothetical protein
MLFCKDCTWLSPSPIADREPLCTHFRSTETDPVTGKAAFRFATVMRRYREECGMDAKLFEPRQDDAA